MAEQEGSYGPRKEGEAEGQISVESLRLRRRFREEHRPKHERRRSPENIEVIELDRRADETRERDLADTRARRVLCLCGRYRRHGHPLISLIGGVRCRSSPLPFQSPRAPYRSARPPRIPSAD